MTGRTDRPQHHRHEPLARLAAEPRLGGLLLDVDGVLAPIVARPEDARVPEQTRHELRRLDERYALVACVSGRAADDAQRVVGVPELVYVGNHGLDLHPGADEWTTRLRDFLMEIDWPGIENKGVTAALHYRGVVDEEGALLELERIAERARAAGFVARFGRKVLELVPPLRADKGTAVMTLLAERGLRRALYAGDDTTDLDAFGALDGLELAIRVAVSSTEGPPPLRETADLVVADAEQFVTLLQRL
jgi:trehalose 6-phosphate phosphatase